MNTNTILDNANKAYYDGKYTKAIKLYTQVLKVDPHNETAKQQLAKADVRVLAAKQNHTLPPRVVQLYRQVLSFIAAKDYQEAINHLNDALKITQSRGIDYPEGENLLERLTDLMDANDAQADLRTAIKEEKWEDALTHIKNILKIQNDQKIKLLRKNIENLMRARTNIRLAKENPTSSDSEKYLEKTHKIINEAVNIPELNQSDLFNEVASSLYSLQNKNAFKASALLLGLGGLIGGISISINYLPGIILAFAILGIYIIISIYEFSKNILLVKSNAPGARYAHIWTWRSAFLMLIGILISTWMIISLPYVLVTNKPKDWIRFDNAQLTYTSPKYLSIGDLNTIDISLANKVAGEFNGTLKLIFPSDVLIIPAPKSRLSEDFVLRENDVISTQFKFQLTKKPKKGTIPFYIHIVKDDIILYKDQGEFLIAPISHLRSIWSWLVGGSGLVSLIIGLFWDELLKFSRQSKPN